MSGKKLLLLCHATSHYNYALGLLTLSNKFATNDPLDTFNKQLKHCISIRKLLKILLNMHWDTKIYNAIKMEFGSKILSSPRSCCNLESF